MWAFCLNVFLIYLWSESCWSIFKKHLQLSFSNRSIWTGEEVWGSDSMFTQYNELFYHKVFDSSWHDPCHFGFFDRLERTQEIFRESDKKKGTGTQQVQYSDCYSSWKPHVSIVLLFATVILITNSDCFILLVNPVVCMCMLWCFQLKSH